MSERDERRPLTDAEIVAQHQATLDPEALRRDKITRLLGDHRLIAGRCRCGFEPRLDYFRYEQHVADAVLAVLDEDRDAECPSCETCECKACVRHRGQIKSLINQRDDWRERAEQAEASLIELAPAKDRDAEMRRLESVEFEHQGCRMLREKDNAHLIDRAERAETDLAAGRASVARVEALAERAEDALAAVKVIRDELQRHQETEGNTISLRYVVGMLDAVLSADEAPCPGCGDPTTERVCRNCHGTTDDPHRHALSPDAEVCSPACSCADGTHAEGGGE